MAPLVVAWIEDIVEAGRRLAADSSGERMALPLTLALDEVAQHRAAALAALRARRRARPGIQTHVVFQSVTQTRAG